MERWPPDFTRTVRAHMYGSHAWVVAATGHCLDLQAREVAHIHRSLEAVFEPDLVAGTRPEGASWLVGVLVCPGDTLDALAAWAVTLEPEALRRVRPYFLPRTDAVKALAAWYARGLPDPPTADVEDWPQFHKRFGLDLNNQIYLDHRGA